MRRSQLNRGILFLCVRIRYVFKASQQKLKKIIWTKFFGGANELDLVRNSVTKVFMTFAVAENSSKSDRMDLLSELDLLKKLKPHPNVIQLLGCLTKDVVRCKGGREFSELDYFYPKCAK